MRNYELVFLVHPDLDETAFKDMVQKVSGWITEAGGLITKTDIWGKRRLAYPIRKQKEGQYVLLQIQIPPQFGATLERNLRFQEQILRFMITAVDSF
jgi:small subunit ribosomal protein S6